MNISNHPVPSILQRAAHCLVNSHTNYEDLTLIASVDGKHKLVPTLWVEQGKVKEHTDLVDEDNTWLWVIHADDNDPKYPTFHHRKEGKRTLRAGDLLLFNPQIRHGLWQKKRQALVFVTIDTCEKLYPTHVKDVLEDASDRLAWACLDGLR